VILVDTSIWADHFRRPEPALIELLRLGQVVTHEFVIGELAVGSLRDWDATIEALDALPRIRAAGEHAWRDTVRRHRLAGSGLGFVDCHLVAALGAAPDTRLWTRDRKLSDVAERLSMRADLA
jgi:predicted nucleic acid-binding protein